MPREPYPGIQIIPNFAQDVLGIDPVTFHAEMLADYPVSDAEFVPDAVQWVSGQNKAVHIRGAPLQRTLLTLQKDFDGYRSRYRAYTFTGWQWASLPSTANLSLCERMASAVRRYDEWAAVNDVVLSNHYMITHYGDGSHHIGFHHDKTHDMHPDASITIVKIGPTARKFEIRRREEGSRRGGGAPREAKPFFSEYIPPGAAIIMSIRANAETEHSVPKEEGAGPSGSIAFRTITTEFTHAHVLQRIARSENARANYRSKREAARTGHQHTESLV